MRPRGSRGPRGGPRIRGEGWDGRIWAGTPPCRVRLPLDCRRVYVTNEEHCIRGEDTALMSSDQALFQVLSLWRPSPSARHWWAKYVRSGAQSRGESAVVLTGTRPPALRVASTCTHRCRRRCTRTGRPNPRHKAVHRAAIRGQTRPANVGCVLQRHAHRRAASPWPQCGASLDEGQEARTLMEELGR